MKKINFIQVVKFIGLFAFAVLIANVNACSKKSSSSGNGIYGGYGFGGAGTNVLGSGVAQTPDGAVLALSFAVSPNGQAGAQGVLVIPHPLVGCSLPPGQWNLGTTQPGGINGGDFVNIILGGAPLPLVVADAFLYTNQPPVQNPYNGVAYHMVAFVNIPGCPLNFGY